MSYHALPPDHLPAERTPSQIRWAESRRRYEAEVEALLDSPDRLAAFVASLRLLAPPTSPASTSGASLCLTDETPGPALDLFGRLAR